MDLDSFCLVEINARICQSCEPLNIESVNIKRCGLLIDKVIVVFLGGDCIEFDKIITASAIFMWNTSRETPLALIEINRSLMVLHLKVEDGYYNIIINPNVKKCEHLDELDDEKIILMEWEKEPRETDLLADEIISRDPLLNDKEGAGVYKIKIETGILGGIVYQKTGALGLCWKSFVLPISSILSRDDDKKITHSPQIGLEYSNIPREMEKYTGTKHSGIYVGNVYRSSVFYNILRTGDILKEVNIDGTNNILEEKLDIPSLLRNIQSYPDDTEIVIKYIRDKEEKTSSTKICYKSCQWPIKYPDEIIIVSGLVIGRMSLDMARKFGIPTPYEDPFTSLLIVYQTLAGCKSRKGEIETGDVISKCNGKSVRTIKEISNALSENMIGDDEESYIILSSARNKLCMLDKKQCMKETERINATYSSSLTYKYIKW